MSRHAVMFIVLVLWAPSSAVGQVLLNEAGEFGPEPSSDILRFAVEVQEMAEPPMFRATLQLTQGKATVRVTDSDGKVIEISTGGPMNVAQPLTLAGRSGTYNVEIVPEQAVGTWTAHITTRPEPQQVVGYVARGVGMVYVGIGAVLLWWFWSRPKWRWFWVGAGVWTVGVGLKFACAFLLNRPVLEAIDAAVEHELYLAAGSIYIGLLTGVFEIGVTLVAALRWKKMTEDAARGVAVGVGAGAFEAVLLGVVAVTGTVVALAAGGQLRDEMVISVAPLAEKTPLLWLAACVERMIAILCHTSSRALVLLGVARGRWFWPFLGGFFIMTALDAIAGYVHLAGFTGTASMWWIQLALAPPALLSIPLVISCARHWPQRPASTDANRETP